MLLNDTNESNKNALRERAAFLVAEDKLSDELIAAEAGIGLKSQHSKIRRYPKPSRPLAFKFQQSATRIGQCFDLMTRQPGAWECRVLRKPYEAGETL